MASTNRDGRRRRSLLTIFLLLVLPCLALAHVHWTRVNGVSPETVALYHCDSVVTGVGDYITAASGVASARGLLVGVPSGAEVESVTDVPDTFFGPHALHFRSIQSAASDETIAGLDGDLTIEFWFQWDPLETSSSIEVGLQSGAKILITRDVTTPANDRFGVAGTHSTFVSAPGFTNWTDVGTSEAPFGEWLHVGLTIHSTGIVPDAMVMHDVYDVGTVGRLYLNGHAAGPAPHTMDLAGLQVHDASRVRVQNLAGSSFLDEIAVWAYDWSEDGTVLDPFDEARGMPTAARDWDGFR